MIDEPRAKSASNVRVWATSAAKRSKTSSGVPAVTSMPAASTKRMPASRVPSAWRQWYSRPRRPAVPVRLPSTIGSQACSGSVKLYAVVTPFDRKSSEPCSVAQ